uniref:Uncharacterized protein n=1 Tax=Spirodela intermedia TaxID=51605 RepID=A0A8S0XJJ6_SPIIN
MDSSMCSSAPDPEMWIIQGTLAWRTPPVRIGINVDQLYIHSWDPGGPGDQQGSSLLENPYIPYQCMDSYLSSTGLDQELRDHPFHSGVTEGSYHSSLFHAFPEGLEKAAINRISLILPSRRKNDLRVSRVGPGGFLNVFFFFPSEFSQRLAMVRGRVEQAKHTCRAQYSGELCDDLLHGRGLWFKSRMAQRREKNRRSI